MKTSIQFYITFSFLALCATINAQLPENVIQINLDKILNARPITTLSNGELTTWTKGIDGNGIADGYATMSASLFKGDVNPKALPDNPLFPATNKHPEVLLHYSNNDNVSNQTVALTGIDSAGFDVPSNHFSDLFLALTSAEGSSKIKVIVHYSDGTETKSFEVPDYYQDIAENDPDFCYLAHDLAKWGTVNNMTEKDHHNIDLLNIHPDPKRILKYIQIQKSKEGYLVIWAATGIVVN
jgi:hypothetical protein